MKHGARPPNLCCVRQHEAARHPQSQGLHLERKRENKAKNVKIKTKDFVADEF